MIIQVTQADIDAGQAGSCTMCPIALATARAFGVEVGLINSRGRNDVWVEHYHVVVSGRDYPLPAEACAFIEAFDYDSDCGMCPPFDPALVSPFTFELDAGQPEKDIVLGTGQLL